MDDIIFSTKTGIKSSITYNGLFLIDKNGSSKLGIFSPLKPKIKINNIEFLTGEVNLEILGIDSSPSEIINLWEKYEKDGFPLEDIAQSLYFLELTQFLKSGIIPNLTLLSEVIVLLNSIDRCKQIRGFSQRLNKAKTQLIQLTKARNKNKQNIQRNRYVYEKLSSIENEFKIASYINEIAPIELTDDKNIPDFRIIDNGILIDTKMKLTNDKPAYDEHNDLIINVKNIFSLLMKDGVSRLDEAFDKQCSDIAMVNLTVSSYGFLLSTGLVVASNFRSTIITALEMVKNNEKAVILYTIPKGTINDIFSICFKRNLVEEIGKSLDKIDKIFSRLGNQKNFFHFADYVNGLSTEDLRII